MVQYIQGDLRKLAFVKKLYLKNPDLLSNYFFENMIHYKNYNNDSKDITRKLFQNYIPLYEHNLLMNETERTIVGLLWHENVIDVFHAAPAKYIFPQYISILKNICFADYIDRTTFQYQIWHFNEMSSIMKTFYNNKILHSLDHVLPTLREIRFTKILTKYSTEYNNSLFLYNLCQEMNMDKKDMILFFMEKRCILGPNYVVLLETFFENSNCHIRKLDIKRMYRFLDKTVKKENENDNEMVELGIDDDSSMFEEDGC